MPETQWPETTNVAGDGDVGLRVVCCERHQSQLDMTPEMEHRARKSTMSRRRAR
jgi:hypothetical protein